MPVVTIDLSRDQVSVQEGEEGALIVSDGNGISVILPAHAFKRMNLGSQAYYVLEVPASAAAEEPQTEEAQTPLEAFLDSKASHLTFSERGREQSNAVAALQKSLFRDDVEKALGERSDHYTEGATWDRRAIAIRKPLWERLTVRELIRRLSLDNLPEYAKPQRKAQMADWLASVNARFNSSLEFGQKP